MRRVAQRPGSLSAEVCRGERAGGTTALWAILIPANKADQHRIAGPAVLNNRHSLVSDLECAVGVVDGRS